jgi:hypothetical protein
LPSSSSANAGSLASSLCLALSERNCSTSGNVTPAALVAPACASRNGPTREYASCARFLTQALDISSSLISPFAPTVKLIITATRSPFSFRLVIPVESSSGSIGKFFTAV